MIYFAQLPTGAVKIGYTGIDLETRMAQLEYEFGVPFALIHAVPGDREDESEWHSRFDHLRLPGNGEQFRPGPGLMAAIGRPLLVSSNPDAIETVPRVGFDPSLCTIKIDRRVISKARLVAKHRGISLPELLSELLKDPVDREFLKLVKELDWGD